MPLQDSDNFIIGRGTDSYKITYEDLKDDLNYVPPPVGTIDTPTVTEPNDGAGGGDTRYLKTDAITEVEGGGIDVCETDLIQNVVGGVYTYPTASYFVFQIPADADWYGDDDLLSCKVTNADFITWRLDDPSSPVQGTLKGSSEIARFGDLKGHTLIIARTGGNPLTLNGFYSGSVDNSLVDITEGGTVDFFSLVKPPTEVHPTIADNKLGHGFDGDFNTGVAFSFISTEVAAGEVTLTFPSSNNFDCFEVGDVVGVELAQMPAISTYYSQDETESGSLDTSTPKPDSFLSWTNRTERTIDQKPLAGSACSIGYEFEQKVSPVFVAGSTANMRYFYRQNESDEWTHEADYTHGTGDANNYYCVNKARYWAQKRIYGLCTMSGANYGMSTVIFPEAEFPVSVISKDADAVPPTITVDGGDWKGTDGSGNQADGEDKLVKETPYDTKLTVAGSTDLADMSGAVFSTDGTGAPGPYTQTPYKLVTSEIESVGTVNYDGTGTELHGNSSTDIMVLFNGSLVAEFSDKNVGFRNHNTSLVEFDSPVPAEKIIHFSGNDGEELEITFNDGGTQTLSPASDTTPQHKTLLETPLTNTSGVVSILMGSTGTSGVDSEWIAGFRYASGDLIVNGAAELTFPGDVSTNPDLQYFKPGDEVQGGVQTAVIDLPFDDTNQLTNIGTGDQFETITNAQIVDVTSLNPPDGITHALNCTGNQVLEFLNSQEVQEDGWVMEFYTYVDSGVTPFSFMVWEHDNTGLGYDIIIEHNSASHGYHIAANNNAYGSGYVSKFTNVEGNINTWYKVQIVRSADNQISIYIDDVLKETAQSITPQLGLKAISVGNGGRKHQGYISRFKFAAIKSGSTKVISTGYPNSNTMTVDGGEWISGDGLTYGADQAAYSFTGTYPNTSTTWGVLFSDQRYSQSGLESGIVQWYGRDQGTGGTGIADLDQLGAAGCVFDPPLNGTFRVMVNFSTSSLGEFVMDGNSTLTPTPVYLDGRIEYYDFGTVTNLTYFGCKENKDNQTIAIFEFELNGEVLLDSVSVGDTHVEYQTNGGQGDIISVNTTDNTILLKDTGDRNNRWIAENKAGTDFAVAGPSVIDEPLLTNQVDLRGSDFATTPPGADTLKEIIWDINGTEYSAGVTNPWKPLNNLPTNSTVSVKVKYKGNILEDSDWSPTVTFTTGNSIRSLFTRIAALEANDVTDDATDTALITLIAGLAARIQALEESN